MNLIAIMLALVIGGARQGIVDSNGGSVPMQGKYEFVHQGAYYEPCNIVKGAADIGIRMYHVKGSCVKRVEGVGVMYAYNVDVKGLRVEDRWFYFVVDGKELRDGLNLRE
jgi:hypothetical protein